MTQSAGAEAQVVLEVLGAASLRRGGADARRVLAQPKRLALLVYVALRRPGGFVRRDELAGVFWSESPDARARASLRQALRFLRRHLGDEVVASRGSEEVAVPAGALRCDALDLSGALERGDDEAAVDLWTGELLPGFNLPGAYEFDRWLQAERQRLRAGVARAALRLAHAAEARGDHAAAAARAHRALALEPTNKAVARRLIGLLGHAGDRAAAVAVFDALAERLAAELELDPSPETVAAVDAVRKAGARPAGPGALRDVTRQRVLVLPFEDLTGDAALARLAADAIAQGLSTVQELDVVPPLAAPGAEAAFGSGTHGTGDDGARPADHGSVTGSALEIARRAGAGTLVGGSCYRDGERIRLQARVLDVVAGRLMEAPEPVVGEAASPLAAVETLRDRVLIALAPALTRRSAHVGKAARPPGMASYRAYLDGLDRFIRGAWREALERFRESARLERGYALPRIVCAIAHWNLGELSEARAVVDEAAGLRATLGRFERALLDMVEGWLDGDWAAAHRAARVQAELAPGSIPHFQVAEEARRLNRPREAREVLARLDPEAGELSGWIFYWVELTAAHHMMGDHGRELELASRSRELHPDDPVALLLEIRALAALGRDGDVVRLLDRALATPSTREPSPGALAREAALELRAHGADAAAAPLLERAAAWYRERAAADGGEAVRRELGRTLFDAGDVDGAREIFRELAAAGGQGVQPVGFHHGQLQAHLDAGYLAVIAATTGDREEAGRQVASLEGLDAPFLYGADRYWLAAVAAALGDLDRSVTMLRRAFARGLPYEMFLHTASPLAPLRGYTAFQGLMRPNG